MSFIKYLVINIFLHNFFSANLVDCLWLKKTNVTSIEIKINNATLGCECDLQMYANEKLVLKNAQLDEYNKPEYVEVKLSLLITSDSKHLKIGVRTNPSGYLYILQKGDRNYWHYNFTYQIIFEGK